MTQVKSTVTAADFREIAARMAAEAPRLSAGQVERLRAVIGK